MKKQTVKKFFKRYGLDLAIAFVVLLLLVIILAPAMKAQEIVPYAAAGIGADNIGYTNPDFQLRGGVEREAMRYLTYGEAQYDTANKMDVGDGYEFSFRALGYARKLAGDELAIFGGGGLEYVRLHTSAYQKSAVKPVIGVGTEITYGLRAEVLYTFAGTDSWNHERKLTIKSKWWLHPKWYLEPAIGVYFYNQPCNRELQKGASVTVSIRRDFPVGGRK
jgi:hypothetical protein